MAESNQVRTGENVHESTSPLATVCLCYYSRPWFSHTVGLVDFCRPAVVLNLKQPAEILAKKQKKTGNNLSQIQGLQEFFFKLKHTCLSTVT